MENEIFIGGEGDYELLTDACAPGTLLRVRQKAMYADRVNRNMRYYPASVVQAAIVAARENARAGVMLSEYVHPEVAQSEVGDRVGYLDNPDRKTATVDDIGDVEADGAVWITRTIKNTRQGRQIADALRRGKPYGLSSRMRMRSHPATVNGQTVQVADRLEIHTWDDVDDPAFEEAGREYLLLTDSIRALLEIGGNREEGTGNRGGVYSVAHLDNETYDETEQEKKMSGNVSSLEKVVENSVDSVNHIDLKDRIAIQERREKMNEAETRRNKKFDRALAHMKTLIALKRPQGDLNACYDGIVRLVEEALAVGEDVSDAVDEMLRLQGYTADRPGLIAVPGHDTGLIGCQHESQTGTGTKEINETEEMKETTPIAVTANREAGQIAQRNSPTLDGETQSALEWAKRKQEEERRLASDALIREAIEAACDAARAQMGDLSSDEQEYLLGRVRKLATDPASVPQLVADELTAYSRVAARNRLTAGGLSSHHTSSHPLTSFSSTTPLSLRRGAGGEVRVTPRPPVYREQVDKLLAAADEVRRRNPNEFGKERIDPKRRAYNRTHFIEPLIEELAARRSVSRNLEEFAALDEALSSPDERRWCEAFDNAWSSATDATTLANVYNQPTVAEFMIYQSYQDMRMLQFVGGIGPRLDEMDGRGGFTLTGSPNSRTHVGSVLRIPSEYYNPPALGSGAGYQGTYDEGLFISESQAIPEGVVTLNYLSYAPFSRRLGASIGRDARNAIGNGPLNYPLVARHIAHIGMHKERTLDKALADEMTLASDEYLSVSVVNEQPVLANNSAFRAGGGVLVNLNPSKKATDPVAVGDPSITYGANVIGAIRLMGRQGAATGTGGNASPYYGMDPVVPQRITRELIGVAGQYQTIIKNVIAVTAPANMVLGGYDAVSRSVITALPGGQVATCAVDYNSGVLLFVSGVAGNNGLITTAVTASYSYATNYDSFQVNNVNLPAGVALETYLNGLLRQIDRTAALMGSIGRFVKPDFALMDLNVATNILDASQFFNLNEVKDTDIFPTEDFFARRFGVDMARHNTPWNAYTNRIHVGRREATKYGIDDPFAVEGPYPRYDPVSGLLIDMQGYYGCEISVIATPQAIDNNGNVVNPVSRAILLR